MHICHLCKVGEQVWERHPCMIVWELFFWTSRSLILLRCWKLSMSFDPGDRTEKFPSSINILACSLLLCKPHNLNNFNDFSFRINTEHAIMCGWSSSNSSHKRTISYVWGIYIFLPQNVSWCLYSFPNLTHMVAQRHVSLINLYFCLLSFPCMWLSDLGGTSLNNPPANMLTFVLAGTTVTGL